MTPFSTPVVFESVRRDPKFPDRMWVKPADFEAEIVVHPKELEKEFPWVNTVVSGSSVPKKEYFGMLAKNKFLKKEKWAPYWEKTMRREIAVRSLIQSEFGDQVSVDFKGEGAGTGERTKGFSNGVDKFDMAVTENADFSMGKVWVEVTGTERLYAGRAGTELFVRTDKLEWAAAHSEDKTFIVLCFEQGLSGKPELYVVEPDVSKIAEYKASAALRGSMNDNMVSFVVGRDKEIVPVSRLMDSIREELILVPMERPVVVNVPVQAYTPVELLMGKGKEVTLDATAVALMPKSVETALKRDGGR